VDSHAGGHPVERCDDRLLAVQYPSDEALGAALLAPDQVPPDALGGTLGTDGQALAGAEVRTGAEAAAGPGDHDGPYGRVGGPVGQGRHECDALAMRDGVAHIGSIESDPPHCTALFDQESVGGSGRCVDHK
jgi:hypothetical protein